MLNPPMFAEIESPLFTLLTLVQVDIDYYQLVVFRLGFRHYVSLGINDHRPRYKGMDTVVYSCSRGSDAEC